MPISIPLPTEEQWEEFLLHHKYHAAVRRVARGVAHSYNNIFTGLGGQTAMLRHETSVLGTPDDKRGELINELLQRGIDQTSVLYNFTRDTPGESGPQSPQLLAAKALELLKTISRLHRFNLHCQTRGEKIAGKLRDLVLLLFYLGENGVDATPEGGEILLSIHTDDRQQVVFTFCDQGSGFPQEVGGAGGHHSHSCRRSAPWQGLGLFAATILAARYQGTLSSRREKGSTLVSVSFPAQIEQQAQTLSSEQERRQEPRTPPRQCLLVVEDDEAMRSLLLNRLQRRGHMVFCVDTCAEAIEEFNHLHDIITTVLMDVGLGDDSGYECFQKLRAITSNVRVIFMSGDHQPPETALGDFLFLQKPFTMEQLEQAILNVHL